MTLNKGDRRGTALGGALSLMLATVIVKLLGVIYKVPLSYILGDGGMGYFNSAYTVYSFFYLICTAGVPKAIMISVSESPSLGKSITRVAKSAFLAVGAATTVLFLLLSPPLSHLIGNPSSIYTMIAVAPSIIFIAVSGVVRGYLSAEHKFLSVSISQIIEGGGKLVFGLAFAILAKRLGMPLYAISAFTILGVSLGAIFGLVYLLIAARGVGEKSDFRFTRSERREVMKRLYSVSTPITVSAAVMSLTGLLDLFLIMKGLISSGVSRETANELYGNYTTLAVPMFNLAVSLIVPVSVAFLPSMTRAYINNRKDFSEVCGLAFGITAVLTAPLAFGMMMYPREILALLFEDSGAAVGSRPLLVLSIGLFFYAALTVTNTALESMGLVRAPVYSMLVGCAVKTAVSVLLIRLPRYGIMGAPIGTVASYGVSLLVSVVYGAKKCKEKFPIISSFAKPTLLAFSSVYLSKGAYFAVKNMFGEAAGTLAAIGVSGILYLALLILFGILRGKKILKMSKYTKLTGEI